jgi:hypothetical protein
MATRNKVGVFYKDCLKEAKSFDLILFAGSDAISLLIKYITEKEINDKLDEHYGENTYSHVGIVIRKDVLDYLDDDKIYVWESTMSGKLGEGVKNIDGNSFLGIQLRDLEKVIKAYDDSDKTRVALLPLIIDYDTNKLDEFKRFFNRYNNTLYDINPASLLSSLIPCIRPARKSFEELLGTEDLLFCSEMTTLVYKLLGLFPEHINEKNVVPQDFIGADIDGQIPANIFGPPIIMTAYPGK